jgi:hypothetical protein
MGRKIWGKKMSGIFLPNIFLPLKILASETRYGRCRSLGLALQRAVEKKRRLICINHLI